MEPSYNDETLTIAHEAADYLYANFMRQIRHLLSNGEVDDCHHRGILFGVALESIADGYLRGWRSSRSYRNLKRI